MGIEAVVGKLARKTARELYLYGLMLVVLVTFSGLAVETLAAVEQVAGTVPNIAQLVDVESDGLVCCVMVVAYRTEDGDGAAVLYGVANLRVAHAQLFHEFTELKLVLVAHFDDHAGVFGKECLDDVAVVAQVVQIDVQTALCVRETHL